MIAKELKTAPLHIVILGEPVAAGRPRAFKTPKGFIRTYDPAKSRNWKSIAADQMAEARGGPDLEITFPEGPLDVHILCVFSCPKSDHKKVSVPRRWYSKARNDADNCAKCAMDSATAAGVWTDDGQVARLTVERWIAAQGEGPRVEVTVRALEERVARGIDALIPGLGLEAGA